MSKEKRVLSVTNQIKFMYTINGISWIATGILSFFDNIPCKALRCISLLVSVIVLGKVIFSEREMTDEMAERNLNDAKAKALSYLHIALGMIALLALIFTEFNLSMNISWGRIITGVFFLLIGIENLLTGVLFQRLEEE